MCDVEQIVLARRGRCAGRFQSIFRLCSHKTVVSCRVDRCYSSISSSVVVHGTSVSIFSDAAASVNAWSQASRLRDPARSANTAPAWRLHQLLGSDGNPQTRLANTLKQCSAEWNLAFASQQCDRVCCRAVRERSTQIATFEQRAVACDQDIAKHKAWSAWRILILCRSNKYHKIPIVGFMPAISSSPLDGAIFKRRSS